MNNDNKRVMIIGTVLITLLAAAIVIFVVTMNKSESDKGPSTNQGQNTETNNNINQNNNVEKVEDNKVQNEEKPTVETQTIPKNLIGKYINKNEKQEYFILNTNGTAEISFITGDGRNPVVTNKDAKYKIISSGNNEIKIEFYNGSLPVSKIKIGRLNGNSYIFADTETTPTNNANDYVFVREDKITSTEPEWISYLMNRNITVMEKRTCDPTAKTIGISKSELNEILMDSTKFKKYYYGGLGSGGCTNWLTVEYDNNKKFEIMYGSIIYTEDQTLIKLLDKEVKDTKKDDYCVDNMSQCSFGYEIIK